MLRHCDALLARAQEEAGRAPSRCRHTAAWMLSIIVIYSETAQSGFSHAGRIARREYEGRIGAGLRLLEAELERKPPA